MFYIETKAHVPTYGIAANLSSAEDPETDESLNS